MKALKDKKILFLLIVGVVLIIAAIFAGTYSETAIKFGDFSLGSKPYSDWAPPLAVGGIVVLAIGIYFILSKK